MSNFKQLKFLFKFKLGNRILLWKYWQRNIRPWKTRNYSIWRLIFIYIIFWNSFPTLHRIHQVPISDTNQWRLFRTTSTEYPKIFGTYKHNVSAKYIQPYIKGEGRINWCVKKGKSISRQEKSANNTLDHILQKCEIATFLILTL